MLGVAQELIRTALDGMKTYKAKQCFLEVRVTNDAGVKLYTKMGFQATKTVHGYYSDGEDAYVMSKKLD